MRECQVACPQDNEAQRMRPHQRAEPKSTNDERYDYAEQLRLVSEAHRTRSERDPPKVDENSDRLAEANLKEEDPNEVEQQG
jgi:hypothetical protein